jgi:uncharacterized protein with NRDE domain
MFSVSSGSRSTNSFTHTPTLETLRESIFIPKWAAPPMPAPVDSHTVVPEWVSTDHSRWYGTREQTVILVSQKDGRVVYTERTLWDENGNALDEDKRDVRINFTIEGWTTS